MTRPRNSSPQTKAVLVALLQRARTWAYGYELSKQTGLRSGTLYPILMRLSDQGFLEEVWQDRVEPGRPQRHVYRLTPDGFELAEEVAHALKRDSGLANPAEAVQ
jgi:PadR family transcriptional regulator PadR